MKSLFDTGFKRSFMPMMGQEIITSYDQGTATEVPNLYTSYDQGPAAEPVSGLVTWQDLQKDLTDPSKSTDWGKLAQDLVKGAGAGFTAYEKAQTTFDAQRAKAGLSPMPLKAAAASSPSGGINPNVLFLVGGLALVGLVAVIAAKA